MSLKRTLIAVLAILALLWAAYILWNRFPFPDEGHSGGTIIINRYEGTAEPYNLTQADIEQLPPKVLDALQDAIDDGHAMVNLTETQLDKTLRIMHEPDYRNEYGSDLVRFRDVTLTYVVQVQ